MKTVLVLGSPRVASDSRKIAEKAAAAVAGPDEVKKFDINSLTAKGCQACYSCKGKTETCVLKDEMAQVLAACQEADFIIVTSPVYIGDITAQLKLFIDRSFAWYKPDFISNPSPSRLAPGKRLLFILTQGNPNPSEYKTGVADKYTGYFKTHGLKAEALVAVIPHSPEDVEKAVAGHIAEAERLAAALAKA
jgi:multimeric flavodoxin WrbA